MVYLDELRIWGRKIPSPASPVAERPWSWHWALWDCSVIYKEEDMCVRCLIKSNCCLNAIYLYMWQTLVTFPGPLSISGDSERSLPFLFPSLASFPYQQTLQKTLGPCCWVAIGNVFRVPNLLQPHKVNQGWQEPCSLGRHSVLSSHKDIRKRYL